MPIFLKGINYKTTPIEVRERIQKQINEKEIFDQLKNSKNVHGGVLIKTCNRIELYEHALKPSSFFLSQDGLDASMVYHKEGFDAVEHLFQVSSSLDSMVIGEPQILGQVKQAYGFSKVHASMSSLLEHVFQRAFQVAKKVRRETSVGDFSISIGSIAVELCQEFFHCLKGKEVLLLGAGQMAEVLAKHFQTYDLKHLWVINRSIQKAFDLAQLSGGTALGLDHLVDKVKSVDILVASTAAENHLISKKDIHSVMNQRKRRPLVCIDLSVPRNIDPAVHNLQDVYLYDIDDLQNVVDRHVKIRADQAKQAHVMIEHEVDKFKHTIQSVDLSKTAAQLREKMRDISLEEIKYLKKEIDLDESDVQKIEKAMMHMSEKIMLNPILYMRQSEGDDQEKQRRELIRTIFGLDAP